ncbi:MAG TPA: site-2 protease family protein [Solirubrobacteraceae bacterium]|nr:site-2 protease family protein [Solirubrobacteraceae bacterium]
MSWVLTILAIAALVVLHELGHFAVAKATGMRVERFSLFFPPRLVGIRRGETEYMIGAIPAGGYVKITGMSPHEVDQLDPEVAPRAYYLQAPWKRIAVILAGPGMNLLIAFVLFWAVLVAGNHDGSIALSNLTNSSNNLAVTTAVAQVEHDAPATGVMRRGDRIVAIDGRPVHTTGQVERAIDADRCLGTLVEGCTAPRPVQVTVVRDGQRKALAISPRYDKQVRRMLIGIEFEVGVTPASPLTAARYSVGAMWRITRDTLSGFAHALTSSKARSQTSSIIGITRDTDESINAGAGFALVFVGFISLVLAVINLFPFLPLDGGHVLWAVAEKVRGKRVSLGAMMRFSSVGIVLLAFLVISGISNDIGRLGV